MTTTQDRPAAPVLHPAAASPIASQFEGPQAGALPASGASAPDEPPIYLVPTLIGALAVLAGSTALSATLQGSSWVWPVVEVVAVVWLIGVGGRLIRLPPVVTVLLQAAGVVLALTALFTSSGYGGVIPNGSAVEEASRLVGRAWDQILGSVAPTPITPDLSFVIAVAIGVTALVVDVLIAPVRAPALVALPLLCLYSVPASIATTMLPWEVFAAPALLYALLLVVAGYSGRHVGVAGGLGVAVSGTVIAVLTTVAAIVLASSVTGVGTEGRLPRTQGSGTNGIGLSPFASLRGDLVRGDPVEMLRISGLAEPDYLRTVGLETWTPNEGWSAATITPGPLPTPVDPGDEGLVTISSAAFRDRFLPVFQGTRAVSGLGPGWFYDEALSAFHREDAVQPPPYVTTAPATPPTTAALQADTVTGGGLLTETGELPASVLDAATQATQAAVTPFDKALALKNWFTDPINGFTYSLSVPTGTTGDALADFLANRQGYCEQYASAMAVMLRVINIPARVAVGFTEGIQQPDGSSVISSHDAHAWVEVRFDDAGWVRFDPTPLAGGQGGEQGFIEGEEAPESSAPLTTNDAPTAGGLAADTAEEERGPTTTLLPSGQGAGADEGPQVPAGLGWSLLVLAVLGALVAAPGVLRARRRKRRLALASAGGAGAAAAAWAEIEDLAVDHSVPTSPSDSARVAANRLARQLHLDPGVRSSLRSVVLAAERGWYGGDGAGVAAGGSGAGVAAGGPEAGAGAVAGGPGAGVTPGGAETRGGGAVAVAAEPTEPDLGGAVRSVRTGLEHGAPLSFLDRLFPRSVRPPSLRD